MKQFLKLPGLWFCLLAMVLSLTTTAQSGEGYYGPVYNSGAASHSAGTGANAFGVFTGGVYNAVANGNGSDNFIGPNSVAGDQEIGGVVAPIFDTLKFNNGVGNTFYITNTAGVVVSAALQYNNGHTTTVRTNRTAGLAGAIQFTAAASYTPVLTPAAGADAVFTDGFVSKVNPTNFIYPVGNVTDLRTVTASGTGTFTTAWSNSNVANTYSGALPAGMVSLATNGYWEWSGTGAATAIVSIPDETAFASAAKLKVAGFNGTSWVSLGGSFATNTENSTNSTAISVPAGIQALAISQAGVILNAKVFLQGDMPATGTTMRNDLQNYFGAGAGLLPTTSPYSTAVANYAGINNIAGVAGTVSDWVQVEVRLASNSYATSVETRSLLLKPNGSIVDVFGLAPTFAQQTGTARLVIKHRNHLAVMSNDITSFAGTVNYDFTTSLSQASSQAGDPAQMTSKNGVWTMIAADVNNDLQVDISDISVFNVAYKAGRFDQYLGTDINMDGQIDISDLSFINLNFKAGYFSTLGNY